jgi:hypothetical protein
LALCCCGIEEVQVRAETLGGKFNMSKHKGAFHEALWRDETVIGPSERNFGLTFAAVFTTIGLLCLWGGKYSAPYWLGVASVFGGLAIFYPAVLQPLNRAWLTIGLLLHNIITPIVMGLIFFFVIAPFGLIMRAAGKDPLRLKRDEAVQSYWILRQPPGPAPETLKNQF